MKGLKITKEVKILKRKYRITFDTDTTVFEFLNHLKRIPEDSTVDDVWVGDTESYIEFHNETSMN